MSHPSGCRMTQVMEAKTGNPSILDDLTPRSRTLTEDEWAAHVALQTVVAQWFRDKLGFATVPHHAENN